MYPIDHNVVDFMVKPIVTECLIYY